MGREQCERIPNLAQMLKIVVRRLDAVILNETDHMAGDAVVDRSQRHTDRVI